MSFASPTATGARARPPIRRYLLGLLAIVTFLAAIAAVVLARGAYDTLPRTELRHGAPPWAQPCLRSDPPPDRKVCARVRGRIVWRQMHDPDGDGDRHLIVVSRLHTRIVKVAAPFPGAQPPVPPLGTTVDATGWIVRGASGRDEIDVLALHWGAGAGSPG